MNKIDPQALALAREFRADPFGHRSPELIRLLNTLRSGPIAGKLCLVCTRPHAEWRIAVLSGERGVPPRLTNGPAFQSLAEAEWAIFKLRWAAMDGPDLDETMF